MSASLTAAEANVAMSVRMRRAPSTNGIATAAPVAQAGQGIIEEGDRSRGGGALLGGPAIGASHGPWLRCQQACIRRHFAALNTHPVGVRSQRRLHAWLMRSRIWITRIGPS